MVFASSRAAQIPPTKDSTLERLRPTALLFDAVPASLAGCICGWCDVGRLNQLNLPFADVSRTDEEHAECLLDRESVMAIHQSVDLVLAPTHGGLVSMADYQITKIWLHAKVWMASVSHSLLDFDSVRPELDLYYPLRLVAQLQLIRLTLPLTAFEANGRGLVSLKARRRADSKGSQNVADGQCGQDGAFCSGIVYTCRSWLHERATWYHDGDAGFGGQAGQLCMDAGGEAPRSSGLT